MAVAALKADDLSDRLTLETLRILGNISAYWNITDEQLCDMATIPLMDYLRKINGYDDTPFSQSIVHRITALGLIHKTLSNNPDVDPETWASSPLAEAPFNGRAPIDVLPTLTLEQLTEVNEQACHHQTGNTFLVLPTI